MQEVFFMRCVWALLVGWAVVGCGGPGFTSTSQRDDAGGSGDDAAAMSDAARDASDAGSIGDGGVVDYDANPDAPPPGVTCDSTNPPLCCYAPTAAGCAWVETDPSMSLWNWVPACCPPNSPQSQCQAPWPGHITSGRCE